VGWLEGLLRLGPAFEPTVFGVTIPAPFLPGVVVPGILFTVLVLWPFIEARITGDHRMHNLLDWPWETPVRTATGAAGIAFLVVVMLAGANDVLGVLLSVSAEAITQVLQVLIFVVPVLTWLLVWRLARSRRARPGQTLESPAGTRLRRNAAGGFEEMERP
jgi:ubiquinol-cytochrome c reductase cytochrome b subunit